jgi:hypothetical protein
MIKASGLSKLGLVLDLVFMNPIDFSYERSG